MATVDSGLVSGGSTAPVLEVAAVRPALRRARDVDSYRGAVAGVDIEAVRIGQGREANRVMAASADAITVTACEIGFPIRTRTTIGDDRVVVAVMRSAPPGSRWCEIDLRKGLALAYGPGAEHHATNREGLRFAFATTTTDLLRARAEQLGTGLDLPGRGKVYALRPTMALEALGAELDVIAAQPTWRPIPSWRLDGLLTSLALGLASTGPATTRRRDARKLDSRRIVGAAIELARSIGRSPAIHELCAAANVSERRLREAFVAVYGVPPSTYFRDALLAEAHRRLVAGVSSSDTVGAIAMDLGFDHLGRFARRYRQVYGELPSVTLRTRYPRYLP